MLELNLHPPAQRVGEVTRHRILEILSEAGDSRLVTIIAPPGYGKTTILMQRMAAESRPSAWLSFTRADNDPAALLTNVTAALRSVGLIDEPTGQPPLTSETALTNGVQALIDAVERRGVAGALMLDQVNALRSRDSKDVLAAILTRLPDRIRVILASRSSNGLPLALLRSQGSVVELSIPDLAMDENEAAQLFSAVGLDLADASPDTLARTEGWPAGLYLTALAMKAGGSGRSTVAVRGDDIFLADYLREEVLGRLSEPKMTFLTRSSILSRLSGPVCDFVLDTTGSGRQLERLEESNLMVVPLDRTRTWYRYHSLLRDFLRSELERNEPGVLAVLHSRAAEWFDGNGQTAVAIEHAMRAGESERVAEMVGRVARTTYAGGRMETMTGWFNWLEESDTIHRFPNLAAVGAFSRSLEGNAGGAERLATYAFRDADGELIADEDLAPFAWMLRSFQASRGPEVALADAQVAVELLDANTGWHHVAIAAEALALTSSGQTDRADAAWAEALRVSESLEARPLASLALAQRALIAIGRGDWDFATAMIERSLELISRAGLDTYITTALPFTLGARVSIRRGDTVQAKSYMGRASAARPRLSPAIPALALQGLLEMARSFVELADIAGARRVMREASDVIAVVPRLGALTTEHDEFKERLSTLPAGQVGPSSLTNAELRLLPLLVTHLSYPEIGERLFVSRHTVKTQAMSIYRKLGVSSRTDAVEAARGIGLLTF
jgi:LuxR family maltose regulon positive regulatory protein